MHNPCVLRWTTTRPSDARRTCACSPARFRIEILWHCPAGRERYLKSASCRWKGADATWASCARGEIGAVYGLGDVRVGQALGDASLMPRRVASGEVGVPLLMVQITLVGGDHHLIIPTRWISSSRRWPPSWTGGLQRGGSVLLEPILDMQITALENCAGRLLGEIAGMRGRS